MRDFWKDYALKVESKSSEYLAALMLADHYFERGEIEKAKAAVKVGMADLNERRPVATNPATLLSQGKL